MLEILKAHWQEILLLVVAVDQLLIGIFPKNPIFPSIKAILDGILGAPDKKLP